MLAPKLDSSLRMNEDIEGWDPARRLDTLGLACPLPVLKARKILAGMRAGETLLIAASDPMAAIDIPHMCAEDGHRLLRRATIAGPSGEQLYFIVAAGDGPRR